MLDITHIPSSDFECSSSGRERLRLIANAGAPDSAGIRGESWEEKFQHPISISDIIKRGSQNMGWIRRRETE